MDSRAQEADDGTRTVRGWLAALLLVVSAGAVRSPDAVKSKTILWPGGYAAEAAQKGQAG